MSQHQQALDAYSQFFASMTRDDLVSLTLVFTPNARFKDPFNDVHGIAKITAIFQHMFDSLDEPKFIIDETLLSNNIAYLKWQFTASRKNKPLLLTGVSRVIFNSQGLVSEHIDYWDASEQFYMKLPFVGSLLRFIQSKLKV